MCNGQALIRFDTKLAARTRLYKQIQKAVDADTFEISQGCPMRAMAAR